MLLLCLPTCSAQDSSGCTSPVTKSSKLPDIPTSISQRLRSRIDKTLSSSEDSNSQKRRQPKPIHSFINSCVQNITTPLLQSPKRQEMVSPTILYLNPSHNEPESLPHNFSPSPSYSSAQDSSGCTSPVIKSSKFLNTPKSSISQRLRSRNDKNLSSTDDSNPQTHQSKQLLRISASKKYKYRVNKEFKLLHQRLAELQKKNCAYKKTIQRLRVRKSNETVKDMTEETESSYKEDEARSTENSVVESVSEKLKAEVEKFFDDDENSRMCPGKRDNVKKGKKIKQKRYLNDTLGALHKKYLLENPEHKICYSLFCKLRPFWVRIPNVRERETCLCQMHENFELVVLALHKQKIILEPTAKHIIEKLCCDSNNINCLKRLCTNCKHKVITYLEFENLHKIDFMAWGKEKKSYTKNGEEKFTTQIAKQKKKILPKDLISNFEKMLHPYMEHVANIKSQYKYIKKIKSELSEEQCIIHCDFSQNYCTKYAKEIQSFHFGGSRQQISLHTSVIYYKKDGNLITQSFCTMSECLRHDAVAIWAHIIPIFDFLEAKAPHIESVFFISDSPSAQYRNKKMFFIMSCLHWNFPSLSCVEWNYTEHGHGKGAPDGVGGCLKSTADKIVARGNDIPDLITLVNQLKQHVKNVHIEVVEESTIFEKEMLVPDDLSEFRGTLGIHQVIWNSTSGKNIVMRKLSCSDARCLHKTVECQHGLHAGFFTAQPVDRTKNRKNSKMTKHKSQKNISVVQRTNEKNKRPISRNITEFQEPIIIPHKHTTTEEPSTSGNQRSVKDLRQEQKTKTDYELSYALSDSFSENDSFWASTSNVDNLVTSTMAKEILTGLNLQDEDSDDSLKIF